jgi:myo-inositol-1(or 4)-monophosphatase
MDLNQMKAVAIAAAHSGGNYIRSRLDRTRRIEHKGETDLVTEADIGAEKRIIDTIRSSFPDHTILSEEQGLTAHRRPVDHRSA